LNFPIGRYVPINSPIHEIDPRAKLIVYIGLAILSFFCQSPADFMFIYLLFFLQAYLSNVPIKFYLRNLKSVYLIALFIVFFQIFFTPGKVIFQIGSLIATIEGMKNAVVLVLRLFGAVLFSTLLSFTTAPLRMAHSIEDLMLRLKFSQRIARSVGLIFSISMRFIPILSKEAEQIVLAQRARGAKFKKNGLFPELRTFIAIIVPLIVLSIKKADELAIAMQVRGFDRAHKTSVKQDYFQWNIKSSLLCFMGVLSFLFVILN